VLGRIALYISLHFHCLILPLLTVTVSPSLGVSIVMSAAFYITVSAAHVLPRCCNIFCNRYSDCLYVASCIYYVHPAQRLCKIWPRYNCL